MKVYDVSGQLIRVLVSEEKVAGFYESEWDGKNELAENMASGVYFCRLTAGDFIATRKLVLVR